MEFLRILVFWLRDAHLPPHLPEPQIDGKPLLWLEFYRLAPQEGSKKGRGLL
ncbi:MAG: hypothetical protein AB1529_02820 [Candidatus Micrarchaeota archaeon]